MYILHESNLEHDEIDSIKSYFNDDKDAVAVFQEDMRSFIQAISNLFMRARNFLKAAAVIATTKNLNNLKKIKKAIEYGEDEIKFIDTYFSQTVKVINDHKNEIGHMAEGTSDDDIDAMHKYQSFLEHISVYKRAYEKIKQHWEGTQCLYHFTSNAFHDCVANVALLEDRIPKLYKKLEFN